MRSKGCALGSTIIIIENEFTTNKAWAEFNEHLMDKYRNSEVVKDNPDWEMIEFLDGFITTERILQATIARRYAKVNSIKEESHTSHYNQAFDQLVSRNDKKVAAETLSKQRKILIIGNKATEFNQWDLVLTEISIVNQTTPEVSRNFFTRVNLHPLTRIKSSYWTEKIKGFFLALFLRNSTHIQPH